MNVQAVKNARKKLGYTQVYVAEKIGVTIYSYIKKEDGDVKFSDCEKMDLAEVLQFSPQEINEYLYDGILPINTAPASTAADIQQ